MIATTKKKRQKISAILGQTSKTAKSASLESSQGIKLQNSELDFKMRTPQLEKTKATSALINNENAESAFSFPPTLTARLNAMIASGVSFEVSADDFQNFGASSRENKFLRDNRAAILCTLQQGFLQKELFRHSPELLEVFTVEVHERSAIMTDGGDGVCFEAVCDVTRDWIAEAIAKR